MKKLLTIIGIAAASVCGANATLLLDENFSTYLSGNLVGQGGWTQVGTQANFPIQVGGGNVTLAQGTAQDAVKSFSIITSGSLYLFATINFSAKNATADYSLTLGDGGSTAFGGRVYAQSSGSGFSLGWAGSSTAPTTFGAELAFGTVYNVVMRYNIVAGTANDTGRLYVSSSAFDPVEVNNTVYQDVTTWTGGTEVTSFAGAYLRQGTNSGNLTVSDLNVATTFAEAIPEPSTWALIGLGLGFTVWNLRRKRSAKA